MIFYITEITEVRVLHKVEADDLAEAIALCKTGDSVIVDRVTEHNFEGSET